MALPFEFAELSLTPLSADCPREAFSCGDQTVDKWFHQHACKKHDGYDCRVTLLHSEGDKIPVGFYALGMAAENNGLLARDLIDTFYVKFSDKYFPAIQLKWIAVRSEFQNQRLGRYIMSLVLDDFRYAIENYSAQVLILEAIDQKTEDFYHRLGFRRYGPPVMRRRMLIGAKPVMEAAERAGV